MRILQLGLLIALASGVAAILIYIIGLSNPCELSMLRDSRFLDSGEPWSLHLDSCLVVCVPLLSFPVADRSRVTVDDLRALKALQSGFKKCVDANGLGLQALVSQDYCQVTIQYPRDTVPKWVRNSSTILTKEFIDALPNGWEEYAWRRINKGIHLTRYFSESRQGHTPLHGRTYYQMMECLGVS
ncbi:hypothetical protein B296_00048908 [Ensete ventricosum]|uniref:Uncharacterized protein n=1 Tax=Ensete ventricosum TaxID=4639 RepID=A0A426YSS3_ENSVE|nr:hypothetical protein B296_00048908 [Ensete ventricosum]